MTNPVPDAPRAQAREIEDRINRERVSYVRGDSSAPFWCADIIEQAILEATAALRDEHARLTAERDAARAELAAEREEMRTRALWSDDYAKGHAAQLLAAKAEGAREALEQAADKLDEIAKGPFTGDGVIGPLHAVGLAGGFKWAADVLRTRAAADPGAR